MWGLSVFDVTSAAVILLFILLVLALRWKYPHMAKLGLRNVRRRPLEAATLCIGGIVGTAAITGALVTGDSLDMMVRQQSVEALGEVDVICTSRGLVPAALFADTSEALLQENIIDGSASVILLEGSVGTGTGATEGSVNIYGIDNALFELGSFFSDGERIPNLHPKTCAVNSLLAEGLGITGTTELTISIRAPENNDAFYLTSADTLVRFNATATDIYEMKGLGTLNLRSRTTAVRNLFVSRDYLEDVLDTPGMVNTLLLSGPGGRFDGIRRSEDIANRAEALLSERMGYREAGFQVHRESEYVVLTHRDIIFDEEKLAEIDGVGDPSALFTYFVNSVSSDDRSLSYSTVTGVNVTRDRNFGSFRYRGKEILPDDPGNDGIILNNWTASYLNVDIGQTVELNYTIYDEQYNRKDGNIALSVRAMIDIEGKAAESWLMPELPGLADIDTCSQWSPPFDIDLSGVGSIDEEYWAEYGGIPKAYVSLDLARELWGNHQGDSTHLKIATGASGGTDGDSILALINGSISVDDAGMEVREVKREHLGTGVTMWIFTGMFLTFGSLIVLGGILLIVNMFLGLVDGRRREIGILKSQGAGLPEVGAQFLSENAVYTLVIVIIGISGGLAVGWGIIHALNTVWAGSVESNSVPFHFGWDTLLISAAASILICLLSVAIPSLRIARMNVSEALTVHGGGSASTTGNTGKPWGLLPVVGLTILIVNGFMTLPSSAVLVMIAYFLMLTGSGIFLYRQRSRRFLLSSFLLLLSLVITIERGISYGHSPDGTGTSVFITMGLLLLITSLVLLFMGIRHSTLTARFGGYVARIALSGVRRRTGRTALMTATMSLAVFAIVALYAAESSERQGMEENMDGMTGGYDVRAVLTVPYTSDMGSDGHGFLSDTASLGIRSVGNEGGSCSNMNARFPPQIIGVPGEFRDKNTVTFRDSIHGGKTDREIWQSINDTASPYIPVTVDYNTLVWVYSGSLGDVYSVRGDDGGQYELKVVSIMDSSIYAGMFVMSSENILRVYPQSAKYTYYLFSTDGDPGEKALEIERELAEYGVDAVPTGELARENLEFEASYMGIFRVFLVLGLLSGTAGVAVMIYRSTRERRREIGILRSLGVGSGGIMGAFLLETAFICLPGIIIGSAAGVTAAYVSFGMGASSSFVFPLWGAVVIPAFIFALSLAFSAIPAYSASGVAPVETLRQS